jgi:hypothetical protein
MDVVHAFRQLESAPPGLTIDAGGTMTPAGDLVDPDRGVDIRLQSAAADAIVVLRLTRTGATLRALSAARPAASAASIIEDQLNIHLDDGYRWGPLIFRSPDDFARSLLESMSRRLRAVRDVGPEAERAPAAGHERTHAARALAAAAARPRYARPLQSHGMPTRTNVAAH